MIDRGILGMVQRNMGILKSLVMRLAQISTIMRFKTKDGVNVTMHSQQNQNTSENRTTNVGVKQVLGEDGGIQYTKDVKKI